MKKKYTKLLLLFVLVACGNMKASETSERTGEFKKAKLFVTAGKYNQLLKAFEEAMKIVDGVDTRELAKNSRAPKLREEARKLKQENCALMRRVKGKNEKSYKN